jgi:hypothetical protein
MRAYFLTAIGLALLVLALPLASTRSAEAAGLCGVAVAPQSGTPGFGWGRIDIRASVPNQATGQPLVSGFVSFTIGPNGASGCGELGLRDENNMTVFHLETIRGTTSDSGQLILVMDFQATRSGSSVRILATSEQPILESGKYSFTVTVDALGVQEFRSKPMEIVVVGSKVKD